MSDEVKEEVVPEEVKPEVPAEEVPMGEVVASGEITIKMQEPEEPKLEPPKPRPVKREKPKPKVSPEVKEHMVSEALNEFDVLRDSPNFAGLDKGAWVKNRVAEKMEQYFTDEKIRDAFDRWGFHHGG